MGTPASERTGLTDLSGDSWLGAFKRTVKAFNADQLPVWAAALTYFGILSIFPALLVVVSILGLVGRSATDELLKNLDDVAPGPAQEILSDAIRNLQGSGSASGIAFVIGIVRCDLGGVGLRERLHERLQRDLRGRGGSPDDQDAARACRAHARADGAGRRDRLRGDADRRDRQ